MRGRILAVAGVLLLSGAPAAGAQDGPSPEESFRAEDVALAIQRGLAFLQGAQNADGSWGGLVNATFTSSFANHATYRSWSMGTTALATRALLELGSGPQAEAATERGLDYLIAHRAAVRPAEWDVDNNWAIIYALDTVARALSDEGHAAGRSVARTDELRGAGNDLLASLAKYQSPRGGWGYYSFPDSGWRPEWATSFMTAVAVLAMVEAREAGLEVDPKVFEAGVRAVQRARLPSGAYEYAVNALPRPLRMESINQIKGSLGRIQVCQLALHRAGAGVDADDLEWGLEQFVKYRKFLDVARYKPVPHEAYYANAAYFYLFAHYYAGQVVEALPAERRARWATHVQSGLMGSQQQDGSMWDFYIASNTKSYGTSFGVLALEHSLAGDLAR